MATNKKITELPAATLPLTGTEPLELVQGGVNVQAPASSLGGTSPDASTTTKGIAKLYTSTGSNTDGSMDQNSVTNEFRKTRTVTGADSIVQTDDNKLIKFNSATPFNFTLDQLTANTKTSFINYGAGAVTFVNGSGVTAVGNLTLPGASGSNYPSCLVIYDTITTPRVVNGSATSLYDTLDTIIEGLAGAILYRQIPFNCTIVSSTVVSDISGSIVLDVWKDTRANFPPTVADTITASAKPTLSSAVLSYDATLTGWTKTLAKGDWLAIKVDSASTLTKVTLSLEVVRT